MAPGALRGDVALGRGPSASTGTVRVWLMVSRPATLPAAVVPVLVGVGTAIAVGVFRPLPFIAALAASMLIQIGTNIANDYYDYKKGADTAARLGPVRVTQSGMVAPETVRRAMLLVLGLAVCVGVYLVIEGGWPILLVGVLSVAAALLYTGGPWPFGYHGLGDLVVFVFFGLVAVVGTTYLQLGSVTVDAVVNALPVALLVTAILVVNNLRDIDTDRAAGKRTLAVRMGRNGSRWEYTLLVAAAYLVPLGRWLLGDASFWLWLPWLSTPLAVSLVRFVWTGEGRALNATLRRTAQLHLLFGVLFAASILL